jgi:hypothetical protein
VRVEAARQAQAYLTSLDRICRQLLADGHDQVSLRSVTLIDVPFSVERGGLMRGRVALGMTTLPNDPVLVDELGDEISADEIGHRLRVQLSPAVTEWRPVPHHWRTVC